MALSVGLVSLAAPAYVNATPGALILTAVLAMTLARNRLAASWRGRAEALVLLPFISIATAGVGYLILDIPILGAAAFITAIFLSIWLRRFGPVWFRVGSLIALPFVTLLIAPGGGGHTTPWVAAILSLVALAVVVALRLLAEATHFLPRDPTRPRPLELERGSQAAGQHENPPGSQHGSQAASPPGSQAGSQYGSPAAVQPGNQSASPLPAARASTMRPVASTRMAIQMATGLIAAVIVGALIFPQHVVWVVLTAFLVASGNRGRADVLYKSGLRIVGAAAGSLGASVLVLVVPANHPIASGAPFVVILLVIIAVGLWLRQWTYAAWALVVTLVIALLQNATGAEATAGSYVWTRVLAIIVGALCGLAAAWFVLPVRSEPIARLRIAQALGSLAAFIAPEARTDSAWADAADAHVNESLKRLEEIAPAWDMFGRLTPWRDSTRKPDQWMRLTHEAAHRIRRVESIPGPARRALGEARKSMREPDRIGPALIALNDALDDARTDE
jgi:hypothetical protein